MWQHKHCIQKQAGYSYEYLIVTNDSVGFCEVSVSCCE